MGNHGFCVRAACDKADLVESFLKHTVRVSGEHIGDSFAHALGSACLPFWQSTGSTEAWTISIPFERVHMQMGDRRRSPFTLRIRLFQGLSLILFRYLMSQDRNTIIRISFYYVVFLVPPVSSISFYSTTQSRLRTGTFSF